MAPLLEVENLSVRYGDLIALRDASLTVSEGEVICIIGPNGAGKSTALAAIAGGVTPVSGAIRLDGQSILGQRPEQIARLRLSLVPEGRHIFGTLTVAENLQTRRLPLRRPGRRAQRNGAPSRSFPVVALTSPPSRPAGFRAASSRCWPWRAP